MKISVLLSLFSKENECFFNRSMESIWDDQIRKPDEIILVQDGPLTEKLNSIVSKWKDKIPTILKVVPLAKNVGLASALNEGVKQCSGDYIARMDTDDISLPNRFFIQEEYLKKNPDIALVGGAMIEFNDEDGDIATRVMPLKYEDIRSAFCKTNPFVHPSVIISRQVFDQGLFYDTNFRKNQDLEFWFRIMAAGFKVANLPDVILKFRKDPQLYKKRSKSAGSEFKIYVRGIASVYGIFTWRYLFPIVHYLYRMLPSGLALWIYKHIIGPYWQRQAKANAKK
ncbi:MAG: glycosyltransferase [Bacteroidota bacterium]